MASEFRMAMVEPQPGQVRASWGLWTCNSCLRRFGGRRVLPDFGVNAPIKSGTSDLAVSLMLHPNVATPLVKEFWNPDPQSWRIYYPTERITARLASRAGRRLAPYFSAFVVRWSTIATATDCCSSTSAKHHRSRHCQATPGTCARERLERTLV